MIFYGKPLHKENKYYTIQINIERKKEKDHV
jgi:hypothetical protein